MLKKWNGMRGMGGPNKVTKCQVFNYLYSGNWLDYDFNIQVIDELIILFNIWKCLVYNLIVLSKFE